MNSVASARQEIQQQKELPTLSPSVQHILSVCEEPNATLDQLTAALIESPTISARLLGLSNSAFFGQQGRVHSLDHAISVLGMVTVRSIAAGLALASTFRTDRCPHFRADRYWASAVSTAMMASALVDDISVPLRPPRDSVYMAGLLHNIGLLALVHLHPASTDRAFAAYAADPVRKLGDHLREQAGISHYQAGVWLGSKWHLPDDILLVMEHHYDPGYRDRHWPLVLLEGLCARWANQLLDARDDVDYEHEAMAALGLDLTTVENLWNRMRSRLDGIRDMATVFTRGAP